MRTSSPNRPLRPCTWLTVPTDLGLVSADKLPRIEIDGRKDRNGDRRPSQTLRISNGEEAYVNKALDGECAAVAGAKRDRNIQLNKSAFSLGQLVGGHVLSRVDVEEMLFRAACECGLDEDPGCGERGIRATIRSGLEAGMKEPRGVPELETFRVLIKGKPIGGEPSANGKPGGEHQDDPESELRRRQRLFPGKLTDLGNAERLCDLHGEDLRFCHPWKKWLVWDGSRWREDDTGESTRRATGYVKELYRLASHSLFLIARLEHQSAEVTANRIGGNHDE